jgi:hypothetical protein
MNIHTLGLWVGLLLLAAGCAVTIGDEPPPTTATERISDYEQPTARRQFEGCTVRYAFRNESKQVQLGTLQKQLEVPFDRWATANGYLTFAPVAATAEAEISIVFTNELPGNPTTTTGYGLIRQPIVPLSTLERTATNTCTIYLRDTYPWSEANLQRVLLFQVGAALGLATTTRPTSAMAGQVLTNLLTLDADDVAAIRQLYSTPCDSWRRLKDRAFPADVAVPMVVQNRAFVLATNGLWEYVPPTDSWEARRTYPGTLPTTGPQLQVIALADRALVGEAYETNLNRVGQPGTFWTYRAATNEWQATAPLPQKGYTRGYGAVLNGAGYVVTTLNSQNRAPLVVWQYNAQTNQWSQPANWQYTPTLNLSTAINIRGCVLKNQLYLWLQNTNQRSLRFAPALLTPWLETDSPPVVGTSPALLETVAIRDYAYCLSRTVATTSVLRYNPDLGWKRVADFPGKGIANYSFVLGNRAYVGTTADELWEYLP